MMLIKKQIGLIFQIIIVMKQQIYRKCLNILDIGTVNLQHYLKNLPIQKEEKE